MVESVPAESLETLLQNLEANRILLNDKLGLLITSKKSFESNMINDLRTLNQKITELDLSNYVKNKELFESQQAKLGEKTLELQTANTEITRLKSEITKNRQLIDEQIRQIEVKKTELKTKNEKDGNITTKIQELTSRNNVLEKDNAILRGQIDRLTREIENLKTQLLELPGLKNSKDQLTQQINDLTQQLSQKTTEHDRNSEQIAALEADKQKNKNQFDALMIENKGLKTQLDQLLENRIVLESENLSQKQDIKKITKILDQINDNLRQQILRIDDALIKNERGESAQDELIALIATIKQNLAIAVVKGGNKRKTQKDKKIKRNNMRIRSKKTNKKQNKRNKSKSNSKRGGWVYKSNERLDSQSSEITTNSGSNSDSKSRSNSNVKGEGLRKTKKRHRHSHYKSKSKSRSHKMQ
jgi:chromosome segregation ATPase